MDFSDLDILDEFFGMGDDSNPFMMLIWILPIILFVFYGQRIQLIITSGDIKKKLGQLEQFRNDSRSELIEYIKKDLAVKDDVTQKLDRIFDYFTIMPIDIDPNGIIPKIHRLIRSRVLPFIMEQAEALKDAIPAFKLGQPIGDGIGPLVVGEMMLDTKKQKVEFETVYSESKFEGRKLILLKAEGPFATVGRPAEATEFLVEKYKPDIVVMVDAALKLEGEDSGTVSQGFGAAIGGIGTDRFKIEELATKFDIPIFSVVIKQSVKEAITLMKKEIANQTENIKSQVHEMITDNTANGQTVLVIGVGNTLGVSQ